VADVLFAICLTSCFAFAAPPAPQVQGVWAKLEPAPEPARISVRVDTKALDGGNEGLDNKLGEVATQLFGERGFTDAVDPQDPELVIVVDQTGDDENPTFVVGLSLERAGEIVPGSARQLECSLCTYTDLVDKVSAELPAMVELARAEQVEPGPVEPDPDTGPVDVEPDNSRKIGPVGMAGIGVAVLGLAGVGTGAALVAKGVELLPPNFEQQKDFRTPGYIVLGIGGAALVGGIVMIALDVSKRKQARRGDAKLRVHGSGFAF